MLSQREKFLILCLVLVAVAGLVYFSSRGLRAWEAGLEARIAAREATLQKAEALSRELARLNRLPHGNRLREPLIGFVERLVQRVGAGDRLQLNLIPQEKDKDIETVEAKVESLTLDEAVQMLYAIENADSPLVIEQLEIAPSFRSRTLLRLTLRIQAQKPPLRE